MMRRAFALIRRWGGSTPLTAVGAGVLALGSVTAFAAWRLDWIELAVVTAACGVALVAAIPFVVGRSRLRLDRSLSRDRITVGDTLHVTLVATNQGRTPSRSVGVDERIGDEVRPVAIETLRAGGSTAVRYDVDPVRRTRLVLGPAVLTRTDPLGLMRRDVAQSSVDECWVYPEHRYLSPPPVGFAKDLEGPTYDTSPAGDVAFHTIRPYAIGDDRRHIHWLTTAKTGSLMVRHFVDNRRPHVSVLLDDDRTVYDAESFEVAVSAAASIASSMMEAQLPLSLRLGERSVIGQHVHGVLDTALEALTDVDVRDRPPAHLLTNCVEFVRQETASSVMVLVTGSRSPESLLDMVTLVRRSCRVVIVSIHAGTPTVVALPGAAAVLSAGDLDDFVGAWEGFVG